ncbi:MAG: hypothetical protein KC493_16145 [Bacteriovoracaceae bacterium]|nr:hypothetical protein [Bacteriovoracaceae bacterium]
MKNNEPSLINRQKEIINKVVNHLSGVGFSLYYESTINVCHEIHDIIQNGDLLDHDDKKEVIDLDSNDIQVLLSYKSSCC